MIPHPNNPHERDLRAQNSHLRIFLNDLPKRQTIILQ